MNHDTPEEQKPPLFRDGPMCFYTIRSGPMPGIWSHYGDCKRVSRFFDDARIVRFTSYPQALSFFQGDDWVTRQRPEECSKCSGPAGIASTETEGNEHRVLEKCSECPNRVEETMAKKVPYYYRPNTLPTQPWFTSEATKATEDEVVYEDLDESLSESAVSEREYQSDVREEQIAEDLPLALGRGGNGYPGERYWDAGRAKHFVQFADSAHIFKVYVKQSPDVLLEPAVRYPQGTQDVDYGRILDKWEVIQKALSAPSSGCMIMVDSDYIKETIEKCRKSNRIPVPKAERKPFS